MTKRKSDTAEEDRMKRLIICKLCHETLEDPIILPCFKTICSKHLLNEANNFICNLCDNFHDRTVDKFPVNEELNELVQICDEYVNFNSIDLGPEYKLAKEKCEHLKELINESELLVKDPAFYINDYFTKLRNKVDLSKEQLIEDIEHKYEQIINEIKEIETKCKQNAKNNESNSKLEEKTKLAKENLKEFTEKLESNLNRGNCCDIISVQSRLSITGLKYEMNKCQVALLDSKQYKFNSISTKNSIFGDLVINEAEIIDESRLEGAMRFEVKDFSKFRHTFNKSFFLDQWFLVKTIPWLIGVEMREIDNDIYLEILSKPLVPATSEQLLELNPIKIDINLKMMKTNGESYGELIYFGKFNNMEFQKANKFISFREIMNPLNNLFNDKTDSVTFEAHIKITD